MTRKISGTGLTKALLSTLLVVMLALAMTFTALPARQADAAVIDPPENNIPAGWPWKIKNLAYPTLGCPQIIKKGEDFTLEFDCIGKGQGGSQPAVSSWQVRLLSSNDRWPTLVDCQVQSAVKGESVRWPKGSQPESAANGEWSGPWAGDEVWHVAVQVPPNARPDLYDLKVTAVGAAVIMDTQPHAVQVVAEYKDDYNFIQVSDFHINDPRGPTDSFIPGKYPDPDEFNDYKYNRKAVDDINLINPDFVVMTGDLPFGFPWWAHFFCPLLDPTDTRTDFTDKAPGWDGEYSQAYQQMLRLEVPVVCMPGNHDAYNLQTQEGKVLSYSNGLQDGAHIWPTMIGPRFFGWDYGDKLHITCMFGYDKIQRDTDPLVLKQRSSIPIVQTPPADGGAGWIRTNQKGWLTGDLGAAQGNYDLVVMAVHQPFYGKASWDTWDTQAIMNELMGYTHTYGVELTITGHTHRDDVYIDNSDPSNPVTHCNTTTSSFGTIEYPGFRRIFVDDGAVTNYNYKPDIYSYPTYKDTEIKRHDTAKEAEKALQHLDTPSVVGVWSSTDPNSVDKSFQCSNYFTEGSPPVNLDNTVVDFDMADIGDITRYNITNGTLVDYWRPSRSNITLRVKLDTVSPGGTVLTRVSRNYIGSVSPVAAKEGNTLDVDIVGYGTSFAQGVSQAAFSGAGITVNSTTVNDATHATANITIAADAPPGFRDVNVVTGSDVPSPLQGGFAVEVSEPVIKACSPTEIDQGHTIDLHIMGSGTHFVQGSSQATISGTGITVNSTTVHDATHATANISVGAAAPPGPRDVNVVTNGETPYALVGGLTVYAAPPGPPFIHSLAPTSDPIGAEVLITGGNFGRTRGSSQVTFNGVPAASYLYWSDSEIVCRVPFGAASGPVQVQAPWGDSGEVDFVVTDFTYYFAEGTCRPDFDPYICIMNPGEAEAAVKITYMKGDGTTQEQPFNIPPDTRYTVIVKNFLGEGDDVVHDFSAKVECTNGQEIVAERPMYFNYQGTWTGGHDVIGVLSPSDTFYFAEGTCRPDFDPYICIMNPGEEEAAVKITYMKGDGSTSEQPVNIPANTRYTVRVKDFLGEGDDVAHDFSAKVECTNGQEIVAERPMYFNYQGTWTGGHDVVGAYSPAEVFYFAEGTCRPGFDPYICIQNPEGIDAGIKITYMKGDGTNLEQNITVGAHSRSTLAVKDVLGEGIDTAHDFSAIVESINGVDVVAERPMYFDYNGWCTGGSDVVGALAPSPYFYFAEGTCRPGFETYICIQNPELAPSQVKITYFKGDSTTQEQILTVDPHSRMTVRVNDFLGEGDDVAHDFSAKVESLSGIPVVAERPMYFNYQGAWTGGHDVVGF
jgi:hypothetical protein